MPNVIISVSTVIKVRELLLTLLQVATIFTAEFQKLTNTHYSY